MRRRLTQLEQALNGGSTRDDFTAGEMRLLRPLLEAAYHLLGANHSRMIDDDAEAAHVLVERALRRIDDVLEAVRS